MEVPLVLLDAVEGVEPDVRFLVVPLSFPK
jgi:hypothetical protein